MVRLVGMWEEWSSPSSHTIQSLTPSESAQHLHPEPRQLTPLQAVSSTGQMTGNPEGGAIAFLQVDAIWIGLLNPKKMVSVV